MGDWDTPIGRKGLFQRFREGCRGDGKAVFIDQDQRAVATAPFSLFIVIPTEVSLPTLAYS